MLYFIFIYLCLFVCVVILAFFFLKKILKKKVLLVCSSFSIFFSFFPENKIQDLNLFIYLTSVETCWMIDLINEQPLTYKNKTYSRFMYFQ